MKLSSTQLAQWETTSRLFSGLVNEHLLYAKITPCPDTMLDIQGLTFYGKDNCSASIWIALSNECMLRIQKNISHSTAKHLFHPEDFAPHILVYTGHERTIEFDPGALLLFCRPSLNIDDDIDPGTWQQIVAELRNSSENQEIWFDLMAKAPTPNLSSATIEWEQALVTGHPFHAMPRAFFPEPPLKHVFPAEIPALRNPSISFLSIASSELRVSGPYKSTLRPLLKHYGMCTTAESTRIIVPSFTRQIPAIEMHFPSMRIVSRDTFRARSHASLRTVTLPPEYGIPYYIKFALSCTISSALRTISPWTACVGVELSNVLQDLLPECLWFCRELASVTGAQENFDEAKHVTSMLRENLESRAHENGETLVIAAALAEIPMGMKNCYAERIFDLQTEEQKLSWLSNYTYLAFQAFLEPALKYGICIEAHGQNVLVRVSQTTHAVTGFALRDFGGMKIHMPTLKRAGYELHSALPGSFITTDDKREAWCIIHYMFVQHHLRHLIQRLHVPRDKAWEVVRIKLNAFFNEHDKDDVEDVEEMRQFFFRENVEYKAYLKMKILKKYRDYEYEVVPNILLS